MGVSITSEGAALAVQRHLEESSKELGKSLSKLASGKRVGQASDDAVGVSMSESLRSQIRSVQRAHLNTLDAMSLAQVALGGMSEVGNMVTRMRELAIQAASDTVGPSERGLLNTEAQQIVEELGRLAESTRYLSTPLLNGQGKELTFQIGPDNSESNQLTFNYAQVDVRPGTLGVDGIDLSDTGSARDSLESLDNAVRALAKPRSILGGLQSRMETIASQLMNQEESLVTAHSRVTDVDVARETSEFIKAQVKVRSGVAVLAQANTLPALALRLIEHN